MSISFFLKFLQIFFFNFIKFIPKFGTFVKILVKSFLQLLPSLSSIQFILKNAGNYMQFANMQKPVYMARTFPFVFALKTDKFRFAANGMRTIHG